QTTTAKNAARCATAQADIAQAIKVVGPHARTRAPQLTELGHEPATTPDTATQLVAKNIMQLVAATQTTAPVGTDLVIALENGATAARTYIAGLVGEDVLGPNQTAATGAKGLAARAQHYASKGADRDTATKDAAIPDVAHHRTVSKMAALLHKENDPQKSEETIEALTKVVAEQDALARDLKKVADTVQAGAQAAGLNVKQHVSKFAREVKDAAIEKQREALVRELATTLTDVRDSVRNLRNQPPINGYTHLNLGAPPNHVSILDNLINGARTRIDAEANRPLDPAKGLITQYTERIATVRAQGAIESARIKIMTSWEEAMGVLGSLRLTPAQIHTGNQRVDTIVQAAKTHADPDNRNIIQQHIAAAATAQKLASLYEQFYEVVMTAPQAQRRDMHDSSMHQSQIIRALRDQGGPNFLIQDVIAMLDFAKREALRQANVAVALPPPTEDELASGVSTALQTAEKTGDIGAKTVIYAISGVQDKSDKASRDGARQAAELGQTVGETLQAIVEAAKKAEVVINLETGKYTKRLAAIAMDIDRQADQEAHNKKLSLEQRIQARTETLMQAREVIVELVRSMEDTANVTRTSRLAALEDKDVANKSASQEAIEVLNVFNKKRADIQAANGDLSTQLRAGGDAAIRFAESSVMIYKGIQDLAE
ncbi:MAG TPA: hypothetical protein VHV10_03085, partial [Ktedonobacteraceae bacterium]|nr:hypothetical protein [Ktedonobacteraceae bacterium]